MKISKVVSNKGYTTENDAEFVLVREVAERANKDGVSPIFKVAYFEAPEMDDYDTDMQDEVDEMIETAMPGDEFTYKDPRFMEAVTSVWYVDVEGLDYLFENLQVVKQSGPFTVNVFDED